MASTQAQPNPGKIIPEKILIQKITIINAQVNGPSSTEGGWDELVLKVDVKTSFNEQIGCRAVLSIDILRENEDPKMEIKANFTIEFLLEIENLNDFKILVSESEIQLDSRLGATIVGIIYSTARGIIYSRTAGTVIQGVILPVVDPYSLLQ